MKNDELLHKWINGELSEEELSVFKLRPEYPSLVELYQQTDNLQAPVFDQAAMLSEILKQEKIVATTPKAKIKRLAPSWVKYAAAAVVILLAGWFLWPNNTSIVQHQLANGTHQEGTLPDQSTYVLNAESTLSYDQDQWNTERLLNLEGEAFFDVKKGKSFRVMTPSGAVQVLGTKFNVWSREKTLEVSCQSGKVAIFNARGKRIDELSASDAIRITHDGKIEKWKIPTTNKASWVDGISKFRNVYLHVVLKELQRQFDVRIDDRQVQTEVILTCNFQHEDLELALKTTLQATGIQYEIKGDRVILSEE